MPFADFADRSVYYIKDALEAAAEDQASFVARMKRLAATACDVKLDDETRLRALMALGGAIHKRRTTRRESATGGDDDKITAARRRHDAASLVRLKAKRAASGTILHKITGTMATAEAPDKLSTYHCEACGQPFEPHPRIRREPRFCSAACRQRAWRAREEAEEAA